MFACVWRLDGSYPTPPRMPFDSAAMAAAALVSALRVRLA
jgi:hypothetical protein